MKSIIAAILVSVLSTGCAVVAVADATLTVASAAVSVTATAVETTVDVAAWGVKKAVGADDKKED